VSTYVVKLGGNALDASSDQEALLATLADDIGSVREQGHFVVVVHGGGPQITAVATASGAPTAFVEGLRVTDATMLEAVVMGLSLVNVELCRRLARGSVRPVGLHGASSGLVRASMVGPTWGRAGHRPTVEPTVLTVFDALGFTPVVAPLALDETGACSTATPTPWPVPSRRRWAPNSSC
jgi:acetylglutamate kinase